MSTRFRGVYDQEKTPVNHLLLSIYHEFMEKYHTTFLVSVRKILVWYNIYRYRRSAYVKHI